jgi:disulfide bond formation protein DsbB
MFENRIRRSIWLAFLAGTGVITLAWASEIWGGLVPCALCLQQRWPYYVALPLLLFGGLLHPFAPRAERLFTAILAAASLIFLVGAGLAAYHMGVEYKWWDGPAGCGGGAAMADNTQALFDALNQQKLVRCDEAAFRLFGVSMAGYNFLASLGLAALCYFGFRAAAPNERDF